MTTAISLIGIPRTRAQTIGAKPAGGLPPVGWRIPDFDVWRAGYAGATVQVMLADTTQLAPVYYDAGLTKIAPNPIVLSSQTDGNGVAYGKWPQPIYTYVPYFLLLNGTDSTGVVTPPLTDLDGEDGSYVTVAPTRGQYATALRDIVDRRLRIENFGGWGAANGAAQNTTTLTAAIGAAGAQGGGTVEIPAGTFAFTTVSLPQGVVLKGEGPSATTIFSIVGGSVVTLNGFGSGLRDLTLDGISLNAGSVGVDMLGSNSQELANLQIQRFALGLRSKGIIGANWTKLSIANCTTGADIRGDTDAAATQAGSQSRSLSWSGGTVSLCTTAGLIFETVDTNCTTILIQNVAFISNVGDALRFSGTQNVRAISCYWNDNQSNLSIQDGTNIAYSAINTSKNIVFDGGLFIGGTITLNGLCQGVVFRGMDIAGSSINLTIPANQIVFEDCTNSASTTVTGDLTKYLALRKSDTGIVTGVSTDNNAITAWQIPLSSGQVAFALAKVLAKQRNGTNWGAWLCAAGAECPGASLAYASGTAAFTVGAVLTGGTSKASARINAKSGSTATGTLTLISITGTFQSGEVITDSSGGAARAGGVVVVNAASIDGTGNTQLRTVQHTDTNYAAGFVVAGNMLQLQVTGNTAHVVEWTAKVEAVVA